MIVGYEKDILACPPYLEWCINLANKVFKHDWEKRTENYPPSTIAINAQQIALLKSLNDNELNIIKSYRRGGTTTLMIINALYNALYSQTPNVHINYIVHSCGAIEYYTKRLWDICQVCDEKLLWKEYPRKSGGVKPISLRFNGKESVIEFLCPTVSSDGSDIPELLIIDNAAWVFDETFNIKAKRKTIASTPRFKTGLFYDMWEDALMGTNDFTPISLKWYLDSRFNENLKGIIGNSIIQIQNGDIGMICDVLEQGGKITNRWYMDRRQNLGNTSTKTEIDAQFADIIK
jgi:hypothetical protein